MNPNPNLNRQLWNSKHVLGAGKVEGFPINTKLDAVKYKYHSKDEALNNNKNLINRTNCRWCSLSGTQRRGGRAN